jgi:hypothetical protein
LARATARPTSAPSFAGRPCKLPDTQKGKRGKRGKEENEGKEEKEEKEEKTNTITPVAAYTPHLLRAANLQRWQPPPPPPPRPSISQFGFE